MMRTIPLHRCRARDREPFEVKYPRLLAELEEQFAEGEKLTAEVRKNLKGLAHGG